MLNVQVITPYFGVTFVVTYVWTYEIIMQRNIFVFSRYHNYSRQVTTGRNGYIIRYGQIRLTVDKVYFGNKFGTFLG
jgi:hypothetical protein